MSTGSPVTTGTDAAATAAPERVETPAASRRSRWFPRGWGQLLSIAVVLAVWQLVSLGFTPTLLPGPWQVAQRLVEVASSGELGGALGTTLLHLGSTMALVIPLATLAGFAMGRRRVLEGLGAPWVPFLQTVPDLIVIAFALIIFGLGSSGIVFVGVIIATPFMVVNVWTGVRNVDDDLMQMASAFHASSARVLREIVIPAALPYLLSGVRVALGIAWHVIVFAEYLMANTGVGAEISAAASDFDNVAVFAWAVVVVVMMLIIDYLILAPAQRALRRRLGVAASGGS